jgi:hypothetical protein
MQLRMEGVQMKQGRIVLILTAFSVLTGVSQSQDWKQIGPAPIEGSNASSLPNATASGIINDIAIDPSGSTDSTIYVATGGGGVWKTTDGGAKWSPTTDTMPVLNIGAVAIDPSNPSIVYAGVGGPWGYVGGGIYRSGNGGGRWDVLNPGQIFLGVSIQRIVLPASGTLLVATSNGLYKSIDSGTSFGNNPPAFNNGSPISITTPNGSISNGIISDLKLDTVTRTTVYAAVRDVGLFKSIDAGTTFPASGILFGSASFPPSISGDVFITLAQSTLPDNQTMYVFLCDGSTSSGEPCALFKSTGQSRFHPISLTSIRINQQDYDQIIGVDPQDANNVYIGLRELFFAGDGGRGGFSLSNEIDINSTHKDQHAIAFSPSSHITGPPPTRVYIGSDGGFSSTAANGSVPGSKWEFLNQGLATALLIDIDIGRGSRANNAYTYGAFQDNGISGREPGKPGWSHPCCGDGNDVAVDPLNPLHAIGINDGCFSWTTAPPSWTSPGGTLCNKMTFPPGIKPVGLVRFDPDGGVAYASAGPQLFRSKDNGSTFSSMATFPQDVTAINLVKGHSHRIWVGLADGTLQYTHNAQLGASSTWKPVTIPGAPSGQRVTGIAIDPSDTSTVVVVYPGVSGVTPPSLAFLTINDGEGWANISNNLPDLPLYAVIIIPYTSPHTIVVGNAAGVLQSGDMGKTWQVLGSGFPMAQVTALAFDPHVNPPVLRAATWGRSVFELPFDPAAPQCQASYTCDTITITCSGPGVSINFCGTPNNGGISDPGCVVGKNTVSLTSGRSGHNGPIEGSACTVNEGAKTCIKLDFQYGGEEASGPSGNPCQPCEQGQRWCTKFDPPRCVPDQNCTLQSNQPPTH